MTRIYLFTFLLLLCPVFSFGGIFDFLDPLKSIEDKILANKYSEAELEINAVPVTSRTEGHFIAIKIIKYLEASENFSKLINTSQDATEINRYYESNVQETLKRLPNKIPLSSAVVEKINAAVDQNQKDFDILKTLLTKKMEREIEKKKLLAEEQERLRLEQIQRIADEKKHREQEEEKRLAKYKEDQVARELAYKIETEKYKAEARAAEAAYNKKEDALKKECGDDYKKVRVGMAFSRIQKCVGKFKLTSQINRADGIVSTYENPKGYVHVIDGMVVSWGLY